MFRSAAEVAGAPCSTPPAIYQTHVPQQQQLQQIQQPSVMATPMMGVTDGQSLPNPPRDHVAPKKYESVTIAMGQNCPTALQRATWHVTDFDLRKLMYNGAISMVYHAVDKRSGITVALKLYKRIHLNEIERHQVAREIRLHSELAHDSIIALYAAWKDRAYVYLALEWAPGGDVYSYLKSQRGRLAEELAVPLILDPFMAGLAVIHERGLIHRDIKPENMLLTNTFQVKIADFGLSIDSKQEIANTRLGTIDYLAPEILNCPVKQHPEDHKDRPDTGYTNKVDCWSVGVLAYELLVGQPPFAAPSANETLRLIKSKRVEYPQWLSPESINFMSIVLVRDPTLRPSIADLLQHPWILKYSRREGGGLARNRTRLQQRRPTMDGGMLVRSITTDLETNKSSQKAFHATAQQQQQPLQPLGPLFASVAMPTADAGFQTEPVSKSAQAPLANGIAHGNGNGNVQQSSGVSAKHMLHHSNTYGAGQGLGAVQTGPVGTSQGHHVGFHTQQAQQPQQQTQQHCMPLAPLNVSAMAAFSASAPAPLQQQQQQPLPGLPVPAIVTAPVVFNDSATSASAAVGGGIPATGMLTQSGFASMPVTPHAQQHTLPAIPQSATASAVTAGVGVPSSPEKSVASFSRKLKFWSVSPNSGRPASAAPDSSQQAMPVAAWEPNTSSSNNLSSGGNGGGLNRPGALQSLWPSSNVLTISGATSIFGRLTSGRLRSGQGSPASPTSPTMTSSGKYSIAGNGASGYDTTMTDVSGGACAVPPVSPDAPASPSSAFRVAKGGSIFRPVV